MENEALGQSLSILGVIITAISYQTNSKRLLVAIQSASIICHCLAYFFLGATSGFILNIVCLIRNLSYCALKNNRTVNISVSSFFTLAVIIAGVFSWQSYFSLFMIVAIAINTAFMGIGTPQQLRKSILLTSSLIFVYNLAVFSIGGMMNEVLAISSSIIGIIRFRDITRKSLPNTPKLPKKCD